jgi:hypothetical protein
MHACACFFHQSKNMRKRHSSPADDIAGSNSSCNSTAHQLHPAILLAVLAHTNFLSTYSDVALTRNFGAFFSRRLHIGLAATSSPLPADPAATLLQLQHDGTNQALMPHAQQLNSHRGCHLVQLSALFSVCCTADMQQIGQLQCMVTLDLSTSA